MKIKISLDREEVIEIVKKYVSKTLPVKDIEAKEIYVSESYGSFTVNIEEKIEPTNQASTEE